MIMDVKFLQRPCDSLVMRGALPSSLCGMNEVVVDNQGAAGLLRANPSSETQ
eukprot:CAMPEP_0114264184 /NCGR_PEP_ID=MMETSP0058-20121206/23020_1 /TAXON_ID=36894 /ORGANISM="Pyramimonas parkeae, CCMP726" /LENGTH=51 /DNA_ID=CAMNT_0001380739 /DNA_START=351 /DNA_END=506 /DNA_ORIENTATION=-